MKNKLPPSSKWEHWPTWNSGYQKTLKKWTNCRRRWRKHYYLIPHKTKAIVAPEEKIWSLEMLTHFSTNGCPSRTQLIANALSTGYVEEVVKKTYFCFCFHMPSSLYWLQFWMQDVFLTCNVGGSSTLPGYMKSFLDSTQPQFRKLELEEVACRLLKKKKWRYTSLEKIFNLLFHWVFL